VRCSLIAAIGCSFPKFRDRHYGRRAAIPARKPEYRRGQLRANGGLDARYPQLPLAEALEREGTRYPAVVARRGADAYGYADEWVMRLEAQLEAERAVK